MMDSSHWIGSVTFALRSPGRQALDPVRRALKDDYDRILVRPLQQVLDRADRDGRLVRYRRVEVDLGRIAPGDLGDVLARRIAEGVGRGLVPFDLETLPAARPSSGAAEQLLFFLERGTLAWPAPGRALEAICLSLAGQDGVPLMQLAARLRTLFARDGKTAERFVRQCPALLIARIAAILAGRSWRFGQVGEREVAYVGERQAPHLAVILRQLACGQAVVETERNWFAAAIAGIAGINAGETADEAALLFEPLPSDGAQMADASITDADALARETKDIDDAGVKPETLPLESAGAVLLHPFLAGLFKAVGLLDKNGAFSSDDAASRAVLLIHFAAIGECEAAEPDLALAKLLCGLDIASLVPRAFEATELERSETDAMLRAAIAHWGALGDASPTALRETFLKRPGRLRREGEDWRLTIERLGVDVLIDRLPWAISLVKTPFMARPLKVDWR